jgi:enterochelin esterase-like enzyme
MFARRTLSTLSAVGAVLVATGAGIVIAQGTDPDPTQPGLDLDQALNRDVPGGTKGGPRFEVTLTEQAAEEALDLRDAFGGPTPDRPAFDGRVYVIVSTTDEDEPRFQTGVPDGTPLFGENVHGLRSGKRGVELTGGDRDVFGHPLRSIGDLPPGDYFVQAFLNVYETFRRADGSVVKLHMPCGDGHDIFDGTGNVYSEVRPLHIRKHGRGPRIELELKNVIPPSDPVPPGGTCQQGNPADTTQVKHVKVQSDLLTEYWGRPMYIAANVLLPRGYEDHPVARYPVIYQHGHYPGPSPFNFREDLGNSFSQWWMSDEAPRVIAVTFRHENPYYDDSYAVNSANLGPYGDAITGELMTELDSRFRTQGEPWARSLTGGSTGGWESLAQLVFYPELYSSTFSTCPDPVDFHYHQIVDVYDEANAYYTQYQWNRVPRPSARSVDGNIRWTMEDENHLELALGTNGRSAGQWDIWQAVYGPQGEDGYPAPIWDKLTGRIDHEVAEGWRAKDINHYLTTNWDTVAPDLVGKIHIYTGDDDTFYLEDAVKLLEQSFAGLDPDPQATIEFGNDAPHCYSPFTTTELIETMADFMADHAPPGADLTSWRY